MLKKIPVDIKTVVDKLLLPNIESNKPEVVVEEIPADIKAAVEKELLSRIKLTSLR